MGGDCVQQSRMFASSLEHDVIKPVCDLVV